MFTRFLRWLDDRADPIVSTTAERPARMSAFSTDHDYVPSMTPRVVLPTPIVRAVGLDGAVTAQDASGYGEGVKGAYGMNQIGVPDLQAQWYGMQSFIGYQVCALMAQHWLVEKVCRVPARDAVRKGFQFTINDGSEADPKILDAINAANKRHRLNRTLVEYVKMGRVFGIRVAMFKIESTDPDYYLKPFNPDGIAPGSYRGVVQIDPYWVIPELTTSSASDPTALDFYEPTYWIVNSMRVHRSHLVIMKGPEVADILKPSYLYGGLSLPQLIYERIYAAERTANEAPQLALTKRADILHTDIAKVMLNPGRFKERLAEWRSYLDNYGVKVVDTDDKIERLDTSLADFDAVIMTQYQLVAAVANMPATKLLGTTPKGFNSSGAYETDNYHEELESIQVNDMEPLIDRHMVCLIRSDIAPRFGVKPFSVECTWHSLSTMSAKEQAEVNKTKADTDKLLKDAGAIDGMDIRARVVADEYSGHNGLPMLADNEDPVVIGQDEQSREANGQFGGGSGGDKNSSDKTSFSDTDKVTEEIEKQMDDDEDYADFGLRVLHGDQAGAGVGDTLPASSNWVDGNHTDEKLPGTSTIGIKNKAGIAQAISDLKQYGIKGTVVLVKGESKGPGEDVGETIIKDAQIVSTFKN